MLEIARERAGVFGCGVDLRVGDAQALEFADASFRTVVSTLSLCTIPDEREAVAEAWRVLRPGGKFILLEHVRSPKPLVRTVQQLLDALAVRFGADHLVREPLKHLSALGSSWRRSSAAAVDRRTRRGAEAAGLAGRTSACLDR